MFNPFNRQPKVVTLEQARENARWMGESVSFITEEVVVDKHNRLMPDVPAEFAADVGGRVVTRVIAGIQ